MNVVSDDLRGAKGLLSILKDAIEGNDRETLEDILDRIIFNEMSFDAALSLIVGLLNICVDTNASEIAKVIYDKNETFYPLTSEIDFITILFLNEKANIELLNFLVNDVLSGYIFYRFIHQLTLVNGYSPSQIVQAIYKGWKIFDLPELEGLQQLYDYTVKVSSTIANEIAVKLREYNKFAPIPTWLISIDILPKESSIKPPAHYLPKDENSEEEKDESDPFFDQNRKKDKLGLPDLDTIVNYMISEIDSELREVITCNNDDGVKYIRDLFMSTFNAMSLNDKYEVAKTFVDKRNKLALEKDISLFVIFGPSAPLVGADLDELDYGGARMFTFNNFDTDDTFDDDEYYEDGTPKNIVDWFTGYCQQCNLRIRRRYHAVRVPMKYGGWQGCFHSWECVRNSIIDNDKADGIMLKLVDIYEQQLNNYKVIDRIPDEEYGSYLADRLNRNKELIESNQIVEVISSQTVEEEEIEEEEEEIEEKEEEINNIIEDEIVKIETSPIVLNYYYSETCDICKRLRPQIYQFVKYSSDVSESGRYISSVSINEIDVNKVNVKDIGITQVPTVIIINNGIPDSAFSGSGIMRPLTLRINELNKSFSQL